MSRGVVWLVLGIVLVVVIAFSVVMVLVFDVPQLVVGGGLRTSVYTSSKSCDKFFLGVGDPSKGLPFTWQYSKTKYRCIHSYQSKGSGCKVTYSSSECQESVSVPVSVRNTDLVSNVGLPSYSDWGVGCQGWVVQQKSNFKNLCSNNAYQLVKLEDVIGINKGKTQNRCAITYKKGCSILPRCRLFYGNGNANNRNIIITVDKDSEPLSLVTAGIVTHVLKTRYPFRDYSDRFNVYILNNVTVKHALSIYWDDDEPKALFSACGVSFGDVIIPSKTYVYDCGSLRACVTGYNYKGQENAGTKIDITSDFYGNGRTSVYTHELMHSGGAVGESYGVDAQMWSNASVSNVVSWILRK